MASLVTAGFAVLFLCLPCLWLAGLPLSGLAALLGLVGLAVGARRGSGVVLALLGMLAGGLLSAVFLVAVLVFQGEMSKGLREIEKSQKELERLEREGW